MRLFPFINKALYERNLFVRRERRIVATPLRRTWAKKRFACFGRFQHLVSLAGHFRRRSITASPSFSASTWIRGKSSSGILGLSVRWYVMWPLLIKRLRSGHGSFRVHIKLYASSLLHGRCNE